MPKRRQNTIGKTVAGQVISKIDELMHKVQSEFYFSSSKKSNRLEMLEDLKVKIDLLSNPNDDKKIKKLLSQCSSDMKSKHHRGDTIKEFFEGGMSDFISNPRAGSSVMEVEGPSSIFKKVDSFKDNQIMEPDLYLHNEDCKHYPYNNETLIYAGIIGMKTDDEYDSSVELA
ncbi:hypothetical protein [Piscirickettsia salmonis]|uniref:hypothetical protein n=1 Tax=Piscirickettsia salmonis TaxID=1238 RepID=UPI0007C915C3|nr:hypothetical protein A0O36_01695 [Piscirickettsiaceae bacterium NZ-RLO1]